MYITTLFSPKLIFRSETLHGIIIYVFDRSIDTVVEMTHYEVRKRRMLFGRFVDKSRCMLKSFFLHYRFLEKEAKKKIIHRDQCWGVMMMQPWQSGEMPFPCGKDRPAFLRCCKLPNLKKIKKLRYINPHLGTTSLYQII
jgi:hypothetical protein